MSKYVGNAKLRELLCGDEAQRRIASIGEDVTPTYHSTGSVDEARLVVENAKLRELCADIYEMAYHEYPSAFEAAFADRMRELGVEVDG